MQFVFCPKGNAFKQGETSLSNELCNAMVFSICDSNDKTLHLFSILVDRQLKECIELGKFRCAGNRNRITFKGSSTSLTNLMLEDLICSIVLVKYFPLL